VLFCRLRYSHVSFLGHLDFSEFLSLGHHVLILNTHDTTTPGSSECGVLVELDEEVLLEGIEVLEVFLGNIGESDTGGGLGVAESSESGLSFDEAEWNFLLSAESWQEDHQFNWVNIVGHDDEFGFAFFDEGGDVVETELQMVWLWSNVAFLALLSGFGFFLKSLVLLGSGLWRVFGEEFEEGRGLILVNGLLELVQDWW